SNQTSIIAENGGNIKVGETLTNIGSIIGSLNADEKLSIEANKAVVSNLEDYNRGENAGVNVGGIGFNNKAPIGQTGVQYGSHDKEQDSNATFVNTEVTEAGKKLNLEELGINTDINKAQIVIKDEVVEQIDTNLHTDLLNTTTRQQFMEDTRKAGHGILDIIDSAGRDNLRYEEARTDRYAQYYIEKNPQMAEFIKDPDSKSADEIKQLTKDYVKYLTGKDVEVIIVADGSGSGYINGSQSGEGKKDVFILDVSQIALGESVASIYGHEPNHIDDNKRGRAGNNEKDSNSAGGRLEEILGESGKNKDFDVENWLNNTDNVSSLLAGKSKLDNDYAGYDVERLSFDDQGLERAKKARYDCGSSACVAYWSEVIGNIEVSLKRNSIENERLNTSNNQKKKLAELKAKDNETKKQYSYTEQTKKEQQGYNEYIDRKNKQGVADLKKEVEVNGLPANTVIVVRDESGKEIKYNNFEDYYLSKSPEEEAEIKRLSAINNELGDKLEKAKTSEEKRKIEKELEQNQQKMNAIKLTKMTYNEYHTGVSLANSALSYKDGVLVVDKNKMLGEVEKAGISMGMEVGRIEGGLSQQTVQDLKSKYGTSNISGNDPIPSGDKFVDYNVNDSMVNSNQNVSLNDSSIKDSLSRAQNRNVKTLNNVIKENLKEHDFSGTLRDLQGDPVPKEGGGFWDHKTEMIQSYDALNGVKRGLEGSLENPNLDIAVKNYLQNELDKTNFYINKIEKLFEPFGGVK
nr:hypothetical protein [Sebaldella sp.]